MHAGHVSDKVGFQRGAELAVGTLEELLVQVLPEVELEPRPAPECLSTEVATKEGGGGVAVVAGQVALVGGAHARLEVALLTPETYEMFAK